MHGNYSSRGNKKKVTSKVNLRFTSYCFPSDSKNYTKFFLYFKTNQLGNKTCINLPKLNYLHNSQQASYHSYSEELNNILSFELDVLTIPLKNNYTK